MQMRKGDGCPARAAVFSFAPPARIPPCVRPCIAYVPAYLGVPADDRRLRCAMQTRRT